MGSGGKKINDVINKRKKPVAYATGFFGEARRLAAGHCPALPQRRCEQEGGTNEEGEGEKRNLHQNHPVHDRCLV